MACNEDKTRERRAAEQGNAQDILDTIAKFINCDPNDKENWQKIIDLLVKRVFVYDDDHTVFFNFTDEDI